MYTLITADYRGPTLFGNQFCTRLLFRPWRLIRLKHPFIDMNHVVEELMETEVPMDYARAEKSPYKIHALTTGPAGAISLQPLTGIPKAQAKQTLMATAAMPLLIRIHAQQDLASWDGWLLEHQLLPHLKSLGITDVIWFLNRSSLLPPSRLERLLWSRIIRKLTPLNPRLANLIRSRLNAGNFLAMPPSGMHLQVFQPLLNISGSSRNSAKLFHALGSSYQWMARYLGHPSLPYPTEWAPYTRHMPPIAPIEGTPDA